MEERVRLRQKNKSSMTSDGNRRWREMETLLKDINNSQWNGVSNAEEVCKWMKKLIKRREENNLK